MIVHADCTYKQSIIMCVRVCVLSCATFWVCYVIAMIARLLIVIFSQNTAFHTIKAWDALCLLGIKQAFTSP